jgi:hypothetical protein
MRIKVLTVALAVAAMAAPAAQAHHGPGESGSRQAIGSPAPTTIVKVVKPGGFDWDDAGLGGGVGAAAVALLAVLMVRLRKSRRLVAAGTLGALALVPSALAGQPVTQTLTPPPPSFYTCMAVGSGTICHGTISGSEGPAETGLICGTGAGAFNAVDTFSFDEVAARYYDENGNLTKRVRHDHISGTYTNPLTGATVPYTQRETHTDVLGTPGDLSTSTTTHTGVLIYTLPHQGQIALEAGRVIEGEDGIVFRAGPQVFVDYYENGDTSGIQKLCAALGA